MKAIEDAGIPVTYVSDVTGTPEMMDGRVKTLNPKIHGGILAVRSNPKHMEDMKKNGIKPIDLVVCNLYPFEATIAKPNVTEAEAIENIDIGGPCMVRASAKNFHDVVVITNPDRYASLMKMLDEKVTWTLRRAGCWPMRLLPIRRIMIRPSAPISRNCCHKGGLLV